MNVQKVLVYSTIIIALVFAALWSFAVITGVNYIRDNIDTISGSVETVVNYFVDFFKSIIDAVPVYNL